MSPLDAVLLIGTAVSLAYMTYLLWHTAFLFLGVVSGTDGSSPHVAPPPEELQRTPDMAEVHITGDAYGRRDEMREVMREASRREHDADPHRHDHDPDITDEHLSGEWTLGEVEDTDEQQEGT